MDRINGADTIDIGGGRRGFRDENLAAGAAGTEVTALHLNSVQEELLKVITEAGLVPSDADWTQLWQALQSLGLAPDRARRWLTVNSMTLSSAPGAPASGDAYLIPVGATGIWAGNVGRIALWSGSTWTYTTPTDGHGISLPDGRVFERVAGVYVEKLALDSQSGKWNYAVAGGTANALTATLTPTPLALIDGMSIRLRITNRNTGAATLNVNGSGAVPIQNISGGALSDGDLPPGAIREFTYFSGAWLVTNLTAGRLVGVQIFKVAGTSVYTPTPGTNYIEVEVQGAGGGGAGVYATDGAQTSAGGGGGSGAWAYRLIRSSFAGVTVTVGSAGSVASAADGGAGGASSFGALVSAAGGAGGKIRNVQASGSTYSAAGGAGGIVGASGDINAAGITGQTMLVAGVVFSEPMQTASRYAGGFGSGGNGQANTINTGAKIGAVAGGGLVVVKEYGA